MMSKDIQGIDMFESPKPKTYCIRGMHVAIISAVVVVVGVSVGLGVGLTRPESCKDGGETTNPTTNPATTNSPPAAEEHCPVRDDSSGDWKAFRLPDYINPVHYDLELQPFMDENTYSGNVTIWLKVSKQTDYLWLHIRETKITGQPRLSKGDQAIHIQQCFSYLLHEYLVVQTHTQLAPNAEDNPDDTYQLTLQFAGRLNGSLVGFYMTSYVEDGKTKYIAATDHEPTDARKSFPCFDEPNKKATYTIAITHKQEYEALSNMPVHESVSIGNGWKRTVFDKSVPMSTYLVCFAVHQFTSITRQSKSGIPLKIYVQPSQEKTAVYAADVTKVIFDFFEEYFNMSYSLPKLDKIAIPDFGTGAMENWGLITYRETNLLYDPQESATSNKQRVAAVIAHELVHQWFGNIVTMDWWDDLWLNEGFASFFEYLGVNEAEPSWNMLDQILTDDLLPVMRDDALQSSHPIIVTVSTPAEITSVFDAISYNKGASLLRMLEDWISPKSFQKGCQNYLVNYHFKNAKTDDFWNSLAEASGKPVKEVMDTWTRQMGFPVLNVASSNHVTQKRFLLDSKANELEPPSYLNYKWNIPVAYYSTVVNATHTAIYNISDSSGITLTPYNANTDGFLKINPSHIGFFRVNYEIETWNNLSKLLLDDHKIFSEGDRAGLIDDAFALASGEKLDYNITLDMTKYLHKESEYFPWHRVSSSLGYLTDMLENDAEIYPKYQEYFRQKVKPIAENLAWNDTGSDRDKLLRSLVLQMSCRMGDPEALSNASALFDEWLKGESIAVNLRQLVYRYGMKQSGSKAAWDFMFQKYVDTTLAQEKEKLLQGLASVESISLLDGYLRSLYNTSLIKSQDALNVIYYISAYSNHGKQMAWDWLRLNWEYLVDRYTIGDRNLGRIALRVSTTFNTDAQKWQMENFFERYPEAGAGATPRKQALETVKNNIEWVAANKKGIHAWLTENV